MKKTVECMPAGCGILSSKVNPKRSGLFESNPGWKYFKHASSSRPSG